MYILIYNSRNLQNSSVEHVLFLTTPAFFSMPSLMPFLLSPKLSDQNYNLSVIAL